MAGNASKKASAHKGPIIVIVAVMVILCFFTVQIIRLKIQDDGYARTQAQLAAEYESEEQRSSELEESRTYVQSKEYIEQIARERLGLINPDETVIMPNE